MKGFISIVLFIALLTGCGADDNQVPPNATLEISPAERIWEVEANYQFLQDGSLVCVPNDSYYMDHLVTITLKDSQNRPIGKSKVTIDLTHTASTSSGFIPTLELYDDTNGNYVPDATELVSGEGIGFYETRTDKYSGTISLIMRVYLSCDFKATMYVRAGSASAIANIEVVDTSELPQEDDEDSTGDDNTTNDDTVGDDG